MVSLSVCGHNSDSKREMVLLDLSGKKEEKVKILFLLSRKMATFDVYYFERHPLLTHLIEYVMNLMACVENPLFLNFP